MNELTLSILKPDALARNITGAINKMIEDAGLKIVAQKQTTLSKEIVERFYAIHKHRPFFSDLVSYMIQGPVILQVLYGKDAIKKYRDLMGATNPAEAVPNTIRARFSESIDANTVHGSDSPENAATEIALFFAQTEIFV